MLNYTKPNVVRKLSKAKQRVWSFLETQLNWTEDEEVRIDQSYIAKFLGLSRKSVYNAFKTFQSCHLMHKVSVETGRGRNCYYVLDWTFQQKCDPLRANKAGHPKRITKGSTRWKYIAMNFRQMIETLVGKNGTSNVITGYCIRLISGRHVDLANDLYRNVKSLITREKGLSRFYRFMRGFYLKRKWNLLSRHEDEQFFTDLEADIQEAKEDWSDPGRPSIQDYPHLDDYLDALDKYESR